MDSIELFKHFLSATIIEVWICVTAFFIGTNLFDFMVEANGEPAGVFLLSVVVGFLFSLGLNQAIFSNWLVGFITKVNSQNEKLRRGIR